MGKVIDLTKKTINLIHTSKGWMAQFIEDREIIDLFETDTIPTPYTVKASSYMVLEAVQRQNPNHTVIIR